MTIGDRISEILKEKGLNYRALSKEIPYSDVQIRRICLNESSPKVDFIQQICSIFPEIDLNWLILGNKIDKKINLKGFDSIEDLVLNGEESLMKNEVFKTWFELKLKKLEFEILKDLDKKGALKKV